MGLLKEHNCRVFRRQAIPAFWHVEGLRDINVEKRGWARYLDGTQAPLHGPSSHLRAEGHDVFLLVPPLSNEELPMRAHSECRKK